MKTITVLLLCLIPTLCIAQKTEFRDRYGNLVGTSYRHGNQTEVRDRYNNLVGTERHERGNTEYRDRYGNHLGNQERTDD